MARPAVKKQEIEQAAIRLFALHGLAGTTIKDIAAAANVTEGRAVSSLSEQKRNGVKLYCREVTKLSEAIDQGVGDAAGSLTDRMVAGVQFFYQYYRENPDNLTFVLFTRQSFPMHQLSDENIDPDVVIVKFLRSLLACAPSHNIPRQNAADSRDGARAVCEPIMMHDTGKFRTGLMR